MTFNETYFDFEESEAQLQERIDALSDEVDDLDEDNPRRGVLLGEIQQLESQRKGAAWARGFPEDDEREGAYESDDFPQWDEDVDGVTLAALRSGAYGGLENDLEQDPDAGSGTSGNVLVAEATIDAPYVDDGMTAAERTGAVAQLHPFFRKWASARVDELMDPESGNGISSATSSEGE